MQSKALKELSGAKIVENIELVGIRAKKNGSSEQLSVVNESESCRIIAPLWLDG